MGFMSCTVADNGVVSGTMVRALVLGRFNKKIKIELKHNAKNK